MEGHSYEGRWAYTAAILPIKGQLVGFGGIVWRSGGMCRNLLVIGFLRLRVDKDRSVYSVGSGMMKTFV